MIVEEEGINELGKPNTDDEARTRYALTLSASQEVPHMGGGVQGTLAELVSKYLECVKANDNGKQDL
jgi:hypothetical protein